MERRRSLHSYVRTCIRCEMIANQGENAYHSAYYNKKSTICYDVFYVNFVLNDITAMISD